MRKDFAMMLALLLPAIAGVSIDVRSAPAPVQGGPQQPPVPVPTAPRDSSPRKITIEGVVIVPTARQPDQMMELRIEGQSSERIADAYTDGIGRFEFRDVAINVDDAYYIVVEAEGFQPFHERLDRLINLRYARRLTILLQPVPPAPPGPPRDRQDNYLVDLRQLEIDIPNEAVEEYEDAVRESEYGNVDRSIELLLKAIDLAPDYAEARNHLGRLYLESDRIEEARVEFEEARDLNPVWVIPVVNLGTLEYQQGEKQDAAGEAIAARGHYVAAVELLESAVRVDPFSPLAHYMLGVALYKTADYPRAEEMLRRGLDMNADLDNARLSLINVYNRMGRFPEAIEVLDAYLERQPDGPLTASLLRVRQQLQDIVASP